MKKFIVLSLFTAFALILPLGIVRAEGDGNKVLICHKEPQKQDISISIDDSALDAHLAHGDTRGACPGSEIPEFSLITGAMTLFASGGAFYLMKKKAFKFSR